MIPCSDEGISVERLAWDRSESGLAGGSGEVVFYRIEGGGHTWPGRRPDSFYLGPSALSLDANAIIWEFFERHPRSLLPDRG